jgi:hypothetical protein
MGSLKLLECNRYEYLKKEWEYQCIYWNEFNYSILQNCIVRKYNNYNSSTVNDVTITLDTETSKKHENRYLTIYHKNGEVETKYIPDHNHVVIWMMTIRLFNLDIATIYGRKPSELMEAIKCIRKELKGEYIHIYTHFLGYDWTFLRKFFFKEFGHPVEQLNTKSHYPIQIKFDNGIILKDSLILAQRGLKKWAQDMKVTAQKATGDWKYDEIRNQDTPLTDQEMHYCEFDTLSQAQCIDTLRLQLGKHIGNMPYTSTGILRELVKKEGSKNHAKNLYKKLLVDFDTYEKLVTMFHGGYVHGNRHYLGSNHLFGLIQGYDFASSYPYIELTHKMPMTKFKKLNRDVDLDYILRNSEDHAFIFRMVLVNVRLKDEMFPMPTLQFSKCKTLNDVTDNGRILAAQVVAFYTNEVDAALIRKFYTWDEKRSVVTEVMTAKKGLLPKWYRDIVYQLFRDKTALKHHDDILYTIQKFKLNATFGNLVQRNDKLMYLEDYETGEYDLDESKTQEEAFNEYVKKRSSILPYQWGVWVTSYALKNLFELGSCCKVWLYSDTDSVYGIGWDKVKVKKYNKKCIQLVKAAGYEGVMHEGKVYWPGVAETERKDKYSEFKYMGAKRYCGRSYEDNKLHITVAGLPKDKDAVKVLKDDIRNFSKNTVFSGEESGKKTHHYQYIDNIYIDVNGNETGDSVDLSPCDYKLDQVPFRTIEEFLEATDDIRIDYAG